MKQVNIDIVIDYSGDDINDSNTVCLSTSLNDYNDETSCISFGIYDAKPDKYTGLTTVQFNNIQELEHIIKDFKKTLNVIKAHINNHKAKE